MVKDKEKAKKSAKNGKSAKKQNGFVKYFKDLKSEFKKVVWPSWGKVVNNTGVVLAFMVVSALFIWGVDSGLSALLKLALNA
ncbi:MAG: preprotein translocase subunit SecE [Ruminococcus sp.]|nr:preprotein translocase subunit SecE [Oscillospiraceae bacterium]MCI7350424.1 preprotein translocase subunit SecE [Ruminococcus sp.]